MRLVLALLVLAIAHPSSAEVIYVDTDATGENDGTSWVDAYVDLHDALEAAVAGDELWLAGGTYRTGSAGGFQRTFLVPDGVGIHGGFEGTEHSRDDREAGSRATILTESRYRYPESSDLGAVVTLIGCGSTTVLEGLTFAGLRRFIYMEGSSPRIEHVLFAGPGLSYDGSGGAVRLVGESRPSFYKVGFVGNSARRSGGAVFVDDPDLSWLRMEHVLFEDNTAGAVGGGAVYGRGEFRHVEFRNNSADGMGGGLLGGGVFENVVFIGNHADTLSPRDAGGGGMRGDGVFENVQFIANSAGKAGGGGLFGHGELTNVLFERNSTHSFGGGMAGGRSSTLTNVAFVGNTALVTAEALFCGSSSPRLWGDGAEPSSVFTTLVNATILAGAEDRAPAEPWGAAAVASQAGSIRIVNSVVWGHGAALSGKLGVYAHAGEVTLESSIIQGCGGSGATWNPAYGTDLGGNLDADPLFVDPVHGDCRLRAGSPAIDSGDTDALPADLLTDLDGNPRVIGATVDIGAYEASVPGQAGLYAARFSPGVLNPSAPGADVLVAVEPRWDFGVDRIDPATLLVNGALMPAAVKVGPQQLRLRFERDPLASTLGKGSAIPVVLSGALIDGTRFTATDELTVLDTHGPGPLRQDGPGHTSFQSTTAPRFHLDASPNPLNPSTTIHYGMAKAGPAELVIYDLAGRRVTTLVSGHVPAGEHEVVWDGRDERGGRVGSGVYLAKFNASGFERTLRLVLLK